MSEENNQGQQQEDSQDTSGRIESIFSQFGKHLDDLFDKARSSEFREEVEERFDELKDSARNVESDFKDWKDRNEHKWKDEKDSLDRTAKIVKEGLKDIVDKIRQDRKGEEPSSESES